MESMTSPQVLILQHVPWEKPGRILANLEDLGLETLTLNVARKKKPDMPDFDELAGVVIMGGPMGAADYDQYPGLKAEAKLAKAAISVGKPVLGICLGHQIIATALGGQAVQGRGAGDRRGADQARGQARLFLDVGQAAGCAALAP